MEDEIPEDEEGEEEVSPEELAFLEALMEAGRNRDPGTVLNRNYAVHWIIICAAILLLAYYLAHI